ncbi:DUF411 domain-containing protein [Marilutibacter aestuarii]|uniref:DUF411 domain-containing protein n=1 Tax=Marilutibacter aestuarii TaxID=1706195 RepID=UPI00319E3E61
MNERLDPRRARHMSTRILLALSIGSGVVACAEVGPPAGIAQASVAAPSVAMPAAAAASDTARPPGSAAGKAHEAGSEWPPVIVHKSPSCGCCTLWVEHLVEAGFRVETREHAPDALDALKRGLGIPYGKGSCHTAEVGGYFVEGHVPAEDVKRMLAERIDARGLVLPGMPMGSPGMEMPDGRKVPFAVERVDADGSTTVYVQH